MDEAEAGSILGRTVETLRRQEYADLVRRYIDDHDNMEITGQSGVTYQVEVQAFWDDPRARGGNLCVLVSIDDGSFLRATSPKSSSFIMAPDGTFVGE